MNAYYLTWESEETGFAIDIGPDSFLPDVRCPRCEREWGTPWFWHSSVQPPWIREYRCRGKGDNEALSWNEFVALRARLEAWCRDVPKVLPGAAIGPPTGTAERKQFPDVYCERDPLILSRAVVAGLEAEGFEERFGPAVVRARGSD
ncbi:MAG: hypothetical protein JNL97_02560 [Verrucomicrobiales bacterium]|nr:hypothetical protein [Verrucomicrobiales bacterium]